MSHDALPLEGWDHVELWVGNARQAAYYYEHAFGFRRVAYAGPETGIRDRASYVLRQGEVTLVLTNGLSAEHEATRFACTHGDGVRDIALRVRDAEAAYAAAVERGARSVREHRNGSKTTTAGSRSRRSRPTATSSTRSSRGTTTPGRSCPGTRRWSRMAGTAVSA